MNQTIRRNAYGVVQSAPRPVRQARPVVKVSRIEAPKVTFKASMFLASGFAGIVLSFVVAFGR